MPHRRQYYDITTSDGKIWHCDAQGIGLPFVFTPIGEPTRMISGNIMNEMYPNGGMKLELFEQLKNIGCKVTGSYATGTQYEGGYSINNNRKKSTSDIDFQVPEGKLDEVEEILKKYGIEWKGDESGLITIDTFPQFDFCTFFYPLENKLPTVEIFGTVFETH